MIALWLAVSLVTGALAARKGYSFILWAMGSGILGLVTLSFLPFANLPELSPDRQQELRRTGNFLGAALAAVSLAVVALQMAANAAR